MSSKKILQKDYLDRIKKIIPKNLFKIPDFLLNKQTMFSGKIIDKKYLQNQVFDSINWKIVKTMTFNSLVFSVNNSDSQR